MRPCFCTSSEPSSVDCDESSLHSDVSLVREKERTLVNSNTYKFGSILIDEQSHTLGDID